MAANDSKNHSLDAHCNEYPAKSILLSSDYHLATGTLLFEAESILRQDETEDGRIQAFSKAAWKAPSGSLSAMFQAGALIELAGDADTAFKIYYETYDIHKLPPLP